MIVRAKAQFYSFFYFIFIIFLQLSHLFLIFALACTHDSRFFVFLLLLLFSGCKIFQMQKTPSTIFLSYLVLTKRLSNFQALPLNVDFCLGACKIVVSLQIFSSFLYCCYVLCSWLVVCVQQFSRNKQCVINDAHSFTHRKLKKTWTAQPQPIII